GPVISAGQSGIAARDCPLSHSAVPFPTLRQVGGAVEEHRGAARQPPSAAGRQGDPVLLSALAAAVPSTPLRGRSAGAPGTRSVAGPLPELPHPPTAPSELSGGNFGRRPRSQRRGRAE